MHDEQTEIWLKENGVDWEYLEAVPIVSIDVEASKRNQARNEPLDDKLVETYATAMKHGREFPALVAWRKNGKWVLIGGNHRLNAAIAAGREVFDLYQVNTQDPPTIRLLTWTHNTFCGQRASSKEDLEHAYAYWKAEGGAKNATARKFGVGESALVNLIAEREARARCVKRGFDVTRIPGTHIQAIGSIKNDNALDEVVNTVVKASPTPNQEQLRVLINAANKARTEAEAIKAIDSARDILGLKFGVAAPLGSGRKNPGGGRKGQFKRALGLIDSIVRTDGLSIFQPDELQEVLTTWNRIGHVMSVWQSRNQSTGPLSITSRMETGTHPQTSPRTSAIS